MKTMMLVLAFVLASLLASTVSAASPKLRTCIAEAQALYSFCHDVCEADIDHAPRPCWAKCSQELREAVAECKQQQ
jgi:hypothetical protein